MNIVLLEPEIPPNTGNVARLCAATRSRLHLVGPLGFRLGDRELKRAGMDYWQQVNWQMWDDWAAFTAGLPAAARMWLVEQGGVRSHFETDFEAEDYLVFGRETAGLPKSLLESHADRWIHIPMPNPEARSLNLSNAVAIVLYEGLRQMSID